MMIDENAKQSTDNDSGQNTAREEDLHTTLLHSSNPAFHSLNAMGLKVEIKPIQIDKPGTGSIVEVSEATSLGKEEPDSPKEKKKDKKAAALSKKKSRGEKSIDSSKKKRRGKQSVIESKKKRKGKKVVLQTKKEGKVKKETVSLKKKQRSEDSSLRSRELSHFSQWLGTLSTTVSPIFSHANTGNITEPVDAIQPQKKEDVLEPVAVIRPLKADHITTSPPMDDWLEIEPAVKKHKKSKKKSQRKRRKKKLSYNSGVVLSDDIFSETLADLLASQGHKKQAILMYEKMRLIYPEKSRFFAAKIEELNKKE